VATILLVDDEKILRTLVRVALEKENHHVYEAPTASRALSLARQHEGSIDLLITEITFANKSGIELAETLEEKYPAMRSLFLSRFSNTGETVESTKLARRKIVKGPFDMGVLLEQVNLILGNSADTSQRKPPARIEPPSGKRGVRQKRKQSL